MPKDYSPAAAPPHEQRRPEMAQDDDWVKAFLRRALIGHVAPVWDGQPFINPSTFWYDEERRTIYFHSNVVGRMRANAERGERVCFEASEFGRFLPSNVALEFSVEFASVVAFGTIRVVEEPEEKRRGLNGLLGKYFAQLRAGEEYRPITDKELARTSLYEIAIESWSGKLNWPEAADQSEEWKPLGERGA